MINRGINFNIPNTGIGSIMNMRRDANMSRNNARDQYEADVADFKDSLATDLENSFMSRGDSFLNFPVVSEFPTDIPTDNFYDGVFDNPIIDIGLPNITPPRELDDTIIPLSMRDRFNTSRIFDGPNRQDVIDYFDNIQGPDRDIYDDDTVDDSIVIPPPPPPPPPDNRRPFYQPSRNYDSGVPSVSLNISASDFGRAPGMFGPFVPLPKMPPPDIPPPPDRPDGGDFSIQRLDDGAEGFKFGGALNKGIMRLPQSQQGDTMTTQLFQRGFRPRR